MSLCGVRLQTENGYWLFICFCVSASTCERGLLWATGTAIEIAGDSTRTVFEREVLPVMQQQQQLWPADVQTYEAFELYAGLVQSRAFHMLSENWLTGLAQEGGLCPSGFCLAFSTHPKDLQPGLDSTALL